MKDVSLDADSEQDDDEFNEELEQQHIGSRRLGMRTRAKKETSRLSKAMDQKRRSNKLA